MGDSDMLRQYLELTREVDEAVRALEGLHRQHLQCRPGCSGCCTLSSVLPLEAAALRLAISRLDVKIKKMIRGQRQGEYCPLLVDCRCAVYSARPLICRTHGLPVAYVDYERQAIDVSVCPLNFTPEYEFTQAELLLIDPFNERLALLNREYCSSRGESNTGRLAMHDIIAAAIAGFAQK